MEDMSYCPVCSAELVESKRLGRIDGWQVTCPACGEYRITGTLAITLPNSHTGNADERAKLSHAIRQMERSGRVPALSNELVHKILERPLPKPSEQADLFVRWIGENVDGPGETIGVAHATHASIIGAKSAQGFALVLKHLYASGLVEGKITKYSNGITTGDITLTFAGWEHFEQLQRGRSSHGKAFMAMKFGAQELEQVYRNTFKPAAKAAGFDLVRLDEDPKAGLIDSRLRVEIQSSDLLVADLTHDNNGAYWEAGYAEGLGKPVIYTCEAKKFFAEKSHFDTNHHLTVVWVAEDPDAAGEELKAVIRATLPTIAKIED